MPNRLATESSPYLRQHADNPVDWYPWGSEAFAKAKSEDKPVLLSVGYAACHWCHVMAHESFENAETAAMMNALFVNIKVDREERPDVDSIYMQAVQAMTGHGGWPMTVALTPGGEPFWGGTYFPPTDRQGMPSFRRILQTLSDAWQNKRATVDRTAAAMREQYERANAISAATLPLSAETLERAFATLGKQYDAELGGFGGAPKFPQAMALDFCLRWYARSGDTAARDIVHHSFIAMARGGIYDQIGGGFHRYSVDAEWLVPHFEKMLYDNALLVRLGTHLWQVTRDDEVARVVEETINWLLREMTSPDGTFYASFDADSEGHEGTFYVWT
ncbi:MAG: thioredoxin domain-containing protein, partial [Gemmatimonadota bacterium]|nr:thioredoxin domain-containing protein [Gemmatimonadota bacterium]